MMLRPGSPVWSKSIVPFKKDTKPAEHLLLTLSPVRPSLEIVDKMWDAIGGVAGDLFYASGSAKDQCGFLCCSIFEEQLVELVSKDILHDQADHGWDHGHCLSSR